MATTPTPDPSQQQPTPGAGGTDTQGGGPDAGAPSQAPAPPELMALARIQQVIKQLASQVPAASGGLAKAVAGITEAMSAIVSQPQQQGPSQSPPY